jgi:hypothetical protein
MEWSQPSLTRPRCVPTRDAALRAQNLLIGGVLAVITFIIQGMRRNLSTPVVTSSQLLPALPHVKYDRLPITAIASVVGLWTIFTNVT